MTTSEFKFLLAAGAPALFGLAPLAVAFLAGLVVPQAPGRLRRRHPVSRVLQWVDKALEATGAGAAAPLGTEFVNGALHASFVVGVLWMFGMPPLFCALVGEILTLIWMFGVGRHRMRERRLRLLQDAQNQP